MLLNPYRFESEPPPPEIGDVLLLLHFDEANGATTFVDSSTYGRAQFARVNTFNTTSSSPKWGAGNATVSSGYLTYQISGDDFKYVDGEDLTCEFWVNFASTADVMVMGVGDTSFSYEWLFTLYEGSPSLLVYDSTNNPYFVEDLSFTFATGTWYFVQFVKDGSDLKLYINGTLRSTVAATNGFYRVTGSNFHIGRRYDFYSTSLVCRFDELRFTRDGVQSSDLPAGPFPNPT